MKPRKMALALALLTSAALVACGKVSDKVGEKVSEKAAEKVLESALSKDGSNAKVDLSQGSAKITSTDANGQTSVVEMGVTQISEADLGVPIYPGAAGEPGGMRSQTPEGVSVTTAFKSKDGPDKVATFYRDLLKAKSQGQQMIENSGNDGTMLMLADDKSKNYTQITIAKEDAGSTITIVASHATAKQP